MNTSYRRRDFSIPEKIFLSVRGPVFGVSLKLMPLIGIFCNLELGFSSDTGSDPTLIDRNRTFLDLVTAMFTTMKETAEVNPNQSMVDVC